MRIFVSVSSRLLYNNYSINKVRPTLQRSILTFVTALANICVTRGRYWLVIAVVTAAVITSAIFVAIIIYIIYVGLTSAAWEAPKEAHVT